MIINFRMGFVNLFLTERGAERVAGKIVGDGDGLLENTASGEIYLWLKETPAMTTAAAAVCPAVNVSPRNSQPMITEKTGMRLT